MKRFIIAAATVAVLAIGCLTTKTAEAHGAHCGCNACRGGNMSFGYSGYRGGLGYSGYTPYNVYRAPFVPYGAGYSGGWQPYQARQQFYYQQPRFGLYLGF
jgi:hypothetical protein